MTGDIKQQAILWAAMSEEGFVNVGALRVAENLFDKASGTLGAVIFHGIRGEELYRLWKDVCESDYARLIDLTDEELVAFVRADT